MSPKTVRGLQRAILTAVFFILVSLTWDTTSSRLAGHPTRSGFAVILGVMIALPLILMESSRLADRFRRLSFPVAVLSRTVTYVGALTVVFLGSSFLSGWRQGLTLRDFRAAIPESLAMIGTAFVLYLVVIFLTHLNGLLGPGVLLRFVTGRYHHPRRERRIFMFVALEGSTELAQELSLEQYYGLVNDFFRDVATPVLDSRGEIYEYVGDEVVITWNYEAGLRDANCVRAFFEIEKAVWNQSGEYLKRYGTVPSFKAALHEGEVIAAEMGGAKKVIAFNGEVLNITARILGECNRLGQRLLASGQLVEQLSIPDQVTPVPMGLVELRGASATEIVALG